MILLPRLDLGGAGAGSRTGLPAEVIAAARAPLFVLLALLFVAAEVVLASGRFFLYLPAVVNLLLLSVFGVTLIKPPALAEYFARLQVGTLTAEQSIYCRRVTMVWCLFFMVNGATSLITAAWCRVEVWTLYNGLISYLLLGALFLGELTYRTWRFRVFGNSLVGRFYRRIFSVREGGSERE